MDAPKTSDDGPKNSEDAFKKPKYEPQNPENEPKKYERRRDLLENEEKCGPVVKKGYTEIVLENIYFEEYYKHQRICSSQDEFNEFMSSLRKPLPAAFRVNVLLPLWRLTRCRFLKLADQNNREFMYPLKFFPDNLAFQFSMTDRAAIKKMPHLRYLKQILNAEDDRGSLSRQEAVSMLPPLFLDVKDGDIVLDLCSAPGSKTSEIIDMLSWKKSMQSVTKQETSDIGALEGLVLANDINIKRIDMLIHQLQRLPCYNSCVTSCDASFFPSLRKKGFESTVTKETSTPTDCSSEMSNVGINDDSNVTMDVADKTLISDDSASSLQFDKILADVPCSGDGTLRKQPTIWSTWTTRVAEGLNFLQFSILCRGLELLKVGGRLVYSTCSINPLENESVVCAALNRYQGCIYLVDLQLDDGSENSMTDCTAIDSSLSARVLKNLVYSRGMESWDVPCFTNDKTPTYYRRRDDIPAPQRELYSSTLFVPDDVKDLHIDRCIRVLPHHNNTGGFFIAAFAKIKDLNKNKNRVERKTGHFDTCADKDLKVRKRKKKSSKNKSRYKKTRASDDKLACEKNADKNVMISENVSKTSFKGAVENSNAENIGMLDISSHEAEVKADSGNTGDEVERKDEKRSLLPQPKRQHVDLTVSSPFRLLGNADELWGTLSEFYGFCEVQSTSQILKRRRLISTEMKTLQPLDAVESFDFRNVIQNLDSSLLAVRKVSSRRIYLISDPLRNLIQSYKASKSFKIFNLGVRIFQQHDNKDSSKFCCQWRIAQEGANLMVSYLKKRIFFMSLDVAKELLLKRRALSTIELTNYELTRSITNLDSCRNTVGEFISGGCIGVVVLQPFLESSTTPFYQDKDSSNLCLDSSHLFSDYCFSVACLFSRRGSLEAYMNALDSEGLCSLLFGEGTIDNKIAEDLTPQTVASEGSLSVFNS